MIVMTTVRLECDDGDFVADVIVPIDDEAPRVLTLGERAFLLRDELTYREVTSFTIPVDGVR